MPNLPSIAHPTRHHVREYQEREAAWVSVAALLSAPDAPDAVLFTRILLFGFLGRIT